MGPQLSNPILMVLILAAVGYMCIRGRIAMMLGAWFAASGWMNNLNIGSLPFLRIMAVGVAATALVAMGGGGRSMGRMLLHPRVRGCAFLVAFWVIWMLLDALYNPNPLAGAVYYNFLIYSIGPVLLMLLFVNQLKDIRELAWGFLLCEAPACWASLLTNRIGASGTTGIVQGVGGNNYLRFSYSVAIAVLIGIGMLLSTRRLLLRLLIVAAIALCSYTLVLTSARQSAIALLGGVAYLAWAARRKGGRVFVIIAVAALIVGIGWEVLANLQVSDRFLTLKWTHTEADASIREQYWEAGWQVFLKNPVMGAGLVYFPDSTDTAHNLYIDVLASQGMVGGLFFLWYLGFVFGGLRTHSSAKETREGLTWMSILISIMIFIALHSLASGSVVSEPEFFWAPLLLLQLLAMVRTEEKRKVGAFQQPVWLKPMVPQAHPRLGR
jgi:O-antigen ligase